MLDNEEIDVLHICTPHYCHSEMAEQAIKRGIHVFLEKPVASTRAQWDEFKSMTENYNKVRVGVCFQNRFNESVVYIKKLIQDNSLGAILGGKCELTWCRNEQYYQAGRWRADLKQSGGGVLINQAIHTLDLLNYFIDQRPVSIKAISDNQHLEGIIEVEDMISAYLSYEKVNALFYAHSD